MTTCKDNFKVKLRIAAKVIFWEWLTKAILVQSNKLAILNETEMEILFQIVRFCSIIFISTAAFTQGSPPRHFKIHHCFRRNQGLQQVRCQSVHSWYDFQPVLSNLSSSFFRLVHNQDQLHEPSRQWTLLSKFLQ